VHRCSDARWFQRYVLDFLRPLLLSTSPSSAAALVPRCFGITHPAQSITLPVRAVSLCLD